jgi:hypothetical protein
MSDRDPTRDAVGGDAEATRDSLRPGASVEVRNRFDGSWSRGFEVAARTDAGYRIRRTSDGTVLPGPFGPDEVRRERRRQTWWF